MVNARLAGCLGRECADLCRQSTSKPRRRTAKQRAAPLTRSLLRMLGATLASLAERASCLLPIAAFILAR